LLVCLPFAGAGMIVFAVFGLRPVVAGHWTGTVGWVLVAVSILGLGDLVAPANRVSLTGRIMKRLTGADSLVVVHAACQRGR
jgi:hypothetical protein